MKKRICLGCVCAVISFFAHSMDGWATDEGAGDPWAFLTIGVGARAMGLGGAFVAIADDAAATYWNPAGLGFIKGAEATFMHIASAEDSSDPTADGIAGRHEYLSGVFKSPNYGSFGLSFNAFSIDGIQYTTGTSELDFRRISDANQTDRERAYTLSYAHPFSFPTDTEWFSLGISVRRMSQQFFGVSTGGWGVDTGFLLKSENWLGLKNIRSGYVFQLNLGRSWEADDDQPAYLDGFDVDVPENEDGFAGWRWGLAFDPLENERTNWTVALAVVNRRKGSPPVLSIGTELWMLNRLVAVRGGIDDWRLLERNATVDVQRRYTGGLGIRLPFVQVDYALSTESLAMKHRISLTLWQPTE